MLAISYPPRPSSHRKIDPTAARVPPRLAGHRHHRSVRSPLAASTATVPPWSRRDTVVVSLVGLGLFAVYLAASRHTYVAYDASVMAAVTKNLVNHGTLRTTGALNDYLHLSTPYSSYGLGLSLVAVPAYVVSKVVGHEMLLFSLVNPVLSMLTAVIVYMIGRAMGWARSLAVLATVAYGLLTMALQATTEFLSEPGVTLCIAVMVLALLRWRAGSRLAPLLFGLGLGAAIQFRSDSLITVGVATLAVPLFVGLGSVVDRRNILMVGIPIAASVVGLAWYDQWRYGKPFVTTYHGQGFHTPLGRGLEGLLFSPGKSLFLYDPLAVLGVVGLVVLVRRDRALAVLFALLIVPRVIFFAKWDAWYGGVTWGPRFLMPIVFIFVIGAVEVLHDTARRTGAGMAARATFMALALLSVPVSFISVRVPYELWWVTTAVPIQMEHPSELGMLLDRDNFTVDGSPLRGAWWLWTHGRADMAPAAFRSKPPVGGILLLVAGGGALGAAGYVARRRPQDDLAPDLAQLANLVST